MTGYESKRAAARDKLIELAQEGMSMHSSDAPEYIVCKALIEALEQTAQEPKSITYNEVADAMNSLRKGNFVQKAYAEEVGKLKLYTVPPKPEQEPVAWMHPVNQTCVTTDPTAYARGIPLYTAPPQRPWVDLTDDDCKGMSAGDRVVAMWANRILKERNA